jgi:hypothetical protein
MASLAYIGKALWGWIFDNAPIGRPLRPATKQRSRGPVRNATKCIRQHTSPLGRSTDRAVAQGFNDEGVAAVERIDLVIAYFSLHRIFMV